MKYPQRRRPATIQMSKSKREKKTRFNNYDLKSTKQLPISFYFFFFRSSSLWFREIFPLFLLCCSLCNICCWLLIQSVYFSQLLLLSTVYEMCKMGGFQNSLNIHSCIFWGLLREGQMRNHQFYFIFCRKISKLNSITFFFIHCMQSQF